MWAEEGVLVRVTSKEAMSKLCQEGDKGARAQRKASQAEETADAKALGQGITWLFENREGGPSWTKREIGMRMFREENRSKHTLSEMEALENLCQVNDMMWFIYFQKPPARWRVFKWDKNGPGRLVRRPCQARGGEVTWGRGDGNRKGEKRIDRM